MTIGEREDLRGTLEFLREWRDEDSKWKEKADKRFEVLENRNIAADAIEAHDKQLQAEKDTADLRVRAERGVSRRWLIGIVLSLIVTAAGTVINIVVNLPK